MCEQLHCVTCRYWSTDIKSCIPLGCAEYEYYKCEHCVHRILRDEEVVCNLRNEVIKNIFNCESFEALI